MSLCDDNIFGGSEPIEIVRRWFSEAKASEVNDPDAVALSTVDSDGMPNVRMVLMRLILDDGFVFFTNYDSVKANELIECGKAAFVYHWKSLRRQIRVRGQIFKEESSIADKYFRERSIGSRYGAWASKQSKFLDDKSILFDKVQEVKEALGNDPERPKFWGGFKLIPLEIEFWSDGENRLHDRFRWHRCDSKDEWLVNRLYP